MLLHYFLQARRSTSKTLNLFSKLLDKSPLTSIYVATFETGSQVSPTHTTKLFGFWYNVHIYIEIYKICVEVFEKTISRTEMIDHSFKRKFYGACHRLCQKLMRGLGHAQHARKVLN